MTEPRDLLDAMRARAEKRLPPPPEPEPPAETLDPKELKVMRDALARVKEKSGGNRFQSVHMEPEMLKFVGRGWSHKKIAKYSKEAGGPGTDRAIRYILKKGEAARPTKEPDQIDDHHKWMLRWDIHSFEAFVREFSPYGDFPEHKRSWMQAFLDERRLLLNVPPGHGKSELFMIWVPIWLICRDRDVQILLVSNSADDAGNWALEVSGQLEHNEELVNAYGRFKPENVGDQKWTSKGVFSVTGRKKKRKGAQFTMESRGMGGRVLGRRADFVIVDDPTKQEDAESPATRVSQLKHLRQQVFTRAEPEGAEWKGGRIVVIGQRVHMLDLYGELEKQEWERGPKEGERLWHIEKYPAVLSWEKKETLWPEKWPWDEIELAYVTVGGANAFETMYQQNPMPEGSALVTQAIINSCKDWNRPGGKGYRTRKDALPAIVRVMSVDPSPSKFNGIVVGDIAVSKDSFTFAVMHVASMKAGIQQVKAECDRLMALYKPDYFIFEESGFLMWMREDPWFVEIENQVRFIRHKTGVNKNSMEYGVQSLAGDFEFQRISLPYGDDAGRRMTDILANEALQYPDGDTYDTLMALWFVKFNYKNLVPIGQRGSYIGGLKAAGSGWGYLKDLRKKKDTADEAYKEWHRNRKKQEKEMSRVG